MTPERITGRQCFFLLFLFLLGNLVTGAGAKGIQSGWILLLLLSVLTLPVLMLYRSVTTGKKPGSVFTEPFGAHLGCLLTVLYCALAVLMAGDAIRVFADFLVINDLNDAGALGNSALLSVCVLLLLFCNTRSLAKAAWIAFPLVVLFLVGSLGISVKEMDLHRLLPLFSEEPELLGKSLLSSFAAGAAPAFFPVAALCCTDEPEQRNGFLLAGTVSGVLLAALALRDAAVLGGPSISLFRFPGYAAAAVRRHSEVLISAAFVLAQPFRAALCLRYVQECLSQWKPARKVWYPPLLLALAALSGALSWSSQQVRWRTAGELIISAFLLAGPLLVVMARKTRKRRT